MAVLAVVAAVVLLPALARSKARGSRISCANNLKQIGLSTRQWAMDHGDKFPMNVSMAQGGTMDHPRFAEPWLHFQVMSNELNTPRVLICPEDQKRTGQWSFATNLSNQHVSYFVGLDADEGMPQVLLSGDRNLTTNKIQVKPGLYSVNTNDVFGWTPAMHNGVGNIGLSDGSVQQWTGTALQQYLITNPQTNRLAIP